jgi:hypothetical protein
MKDVPNKQPSTRYRNDDDEVDPFFDEDDDLSEWTKADLGGFPTGIDLIGVCLRVVRKDKEILAYQAASIVLCLGFLTIFAAAIYSSTDPAMFGRKGYELVILVQLFPFYIIASFIATYFSAATVTVATIRMKGGNPHFNDGIEAATKKMPSIVGWAIVNAVVGWFLALLRSRKGGSRVAADIAQLAWGVATYFVVPVMLFEDEDPLSAIDRSTSIVRRTWKESLAGNFGMGFVFLGLMFLGLLAFFPIGYALFGMVGGIIGAAIWIIVVSVISSAANAVLVAALYRLARTGKMPVEMEGYNELSSAMSNVGELAPVDDIGLSADDLTQKYAR